MSSNGMIYLDNAATTPVDPRVLAAMLPYFTESYGNPSAVYRLASKAECAVAKARAEAAAVIGALPEEIFFTGGGSESDNWALKAVGEAYAAKGKHIVTTAVEHPAVLRSAQWLEKQGFSVTYVGVDESGCVRLDELAAAIRPDTILLSVMAANNEIGTIQPLREIGELAKEHGVLFHTDAVQAFARLPLSVDDLHIDLLSASAHKINGPKGVGMLYIRKGVRVGSFLHGGAQERARRAGTLNVPGIVGMGVAASLCRAEQTATETGLRDYFIERVLREIPGTRLNGGFQHRLPNNANFCFPGREAQTLLIQLDQKGICASSGSACASGSPEPSHVLRAIGLSEADAAASLRFTLSERTTRAELERTVEILKEITHA